MGKIVVRMSGLVADVLLQILLLELLIPPCLGCFDSCYSFHTIPTKNRFEGNNDCHSKNGSLVSLETENEWEFIKNEIQTISINEWYIGLSGSKWKNSWKWESNELLTISKWQSGQPSGDTSNSSYIACVVMAKNYPKGTQGLFNDISCDYYQRPYICEYKNRVASIPGSFRTTCCPFKTTTPPYIPTTTTSKQVIPPSTTTTHDITTSSPLTKPSDDASPTNKVNADAAQDTPTSSVLIIAIVLAVILMVVICVFMAVCFRTRRRKCKHSTLTNRSLSTRTQVTNVNSPGAAQTSAFESVIYAEVDDNHIQNTDTGYDTGYSDVKPHSRPGDEYSQPPATQPVDYYSNINDTRFIRTQDAGNWGVNYCQDPPSSVCLVTAQPWPVYEELDKSNEACKKTAVVGKATSKVSDNSQLSNASAVYAMVDKSQKNKEIEMKKARVGMATDELPALPPTYATADRQTKKNAGVGMATDKHDALQGNRNKHHQYKLAEDHGEELTYETARCDKTTYENTNRYCQNELLSTENLLYEGFSDSETNSCYTDKTAENPLYFRNTYD